MLEAVGQVQRFLQADVEAALEVEVGGQLGGNPGAGGETVWRVLTQRRVLVVGGALLRFVAPVGGGHVPVPRADAAFAADCGLEIILVDEPGRRITGRVAVRSGRNGVGDGGQAVVLPLLGVAS